MMTENPEIWNLSALCRCCHSDGYFKSLQDSYTYENEIEIYSKMLRDAINIEIRPPQPLMEASYTICDACILRLREAHRFKQQVLLCEKKFEEYCKNELTSRIVCNDAIKTELDSTDDYDDGPPTVDYYTSQYEIEIKCDGMLTKQEENDYDASMYKQIKCEEDSKSKIEIEIPELARRNDARGDAKKRVRKKLKTGTRIKKYDSSLEVHVKTDSGVLYSCRACGGSYPDHKDLKRHIQLTHTERKYKCYYCPERFAAAADRSAHVRAHSERAARCAYCDKVFYVRAALRDHENTHTRATVFKCDLCSKEFAYKATLRMHLRGHYGTKKRCICHHCGHGFNDRANLNAHVLTVHEKQRPYPCELCPKTFTAKKHLKSHMLRHTGEQPFFCDQCPKRFYCNSSLKNHKISHIDKVNRYSCKVCRKRFADRSVFVKHLRKAHVGQRPFKCTICEKDFVCKYSMKRHVLEHSGVKPFECGVCDAKFTQKGALKRHSDRKHGEPKEGATEKCEVCNKLVVDLKKHMLCHNNKRFSCEYCDKSYSENNVLTRHKKVVHFGIKPHVCEFCDKKYVKINSLKNHQLKVHKIVSKIETDEDFDSAVAKFSIKNKKGKIKTEGGVEEIPFV